MRGCRCPTHWKGLVWRDTLPVAPAERRGAESCQTPRHTSEVPTVTCNEALARRTEQQRLRAAYLEHPEKTLPRSHISRHTRVLPGSQGQTTAPGETDNRVEVGARAEKPV